MQFVDYLAVGASFSYEQKPLRLFSLLMHKQWLILMVIKAQASWSLVDDMVNPRQGS